MLDGAALKRLCVSGLLLFVFLHGCDGSNDGGGGFGKCVMPDRLTETDCIAEDVLNLCEPLFCGAEFPTDDPDVFLAVDFLLPSDPSACLIPDCNTLDCGIHGFFSDITIEGISFPRGTVTFIDEELADFICFGTL